MKIAYMVTAYGNPPPGVTCGDCVHLYRHHSPADKTFFKCGKYGFTRGAATDWRMSWTGCGQWEQRSEPV